MSSIFSGGVKFSSEEFADLVISLEDDISFVNVLWGKTGLQTISLKHASNFDCSCSIIAIKPLLSRSKSAILVLAVFNNIFKVLRSSLLAIHLERNSSTRARIELWKRLRIEMWHLNNLIDHFRRNFEIFNSLNNFSTKWKENEGNIFCTHFIFLLSESIAACGYLNSQLNEFYHIAISKTN